jgi:hypothetical protein
VDGRDAVEVTGPAERDGRPAIERQADFNIAFQELEAEVRRACSRQAEWPGKIAGGIDAALEFAARRPHEITALTVADAAFRAGPDGTRHPELIEHYSEMLGEAAPAKERLPASTNEALVSTIVGVVVIHLKCDTADRLRDAAPDLIHLTLLPYTGFAEARRWAERPSAAD